MILLTRPLEDSLRLAKEFEEKNISVFIEPMLKIELLDPPAVAVGTYGAVALTSRHAVPALSKLFRGEPSLPIYCVGGKTALRVREAGFQNVIEGGGSGLLMKELIRKTLKTHLSKILYLRGEIVKGKWSRDLQEEGYLIDEMIVYKAHAATTLSPELVDLLKKNQITEIPFYSDRTREIFFSLVRQAGINSDFLEKTFNSFLKKG